MRRRGAAREARRALRTARATGSVRASLKGGAYKPLSERDIERVHHTALDVLEKVGVMFPHVTLLADTWDARRVKAGGLRMSSLGIILGLGFALVTSRLVSTMLFGITPHDPLTYGGIATLLLSVALLACYLPARRASRVDPTVALRA